MALIIRLLLGSLEASHQRDGPHRLSARTYIYLLSACRIIQVFILEASAKCIFPNFKSTARKKQISYDIK